MFPSLHCFLCCPSVIPFVVVIVVVVVALLLLLLLFTSVFLFNPRSLLLFFVVVFVIAVCLLFIFFLHSFFRLQTFFPLRLPSFFNWPAFFDGSHSVKFLPTFDQVTVSHATRARHSALTTPTTTCTLVTARHCTTAGGGTMPAMFPT